MKPPLLVSIIINNYNYGRFLAQAIDSALAQIYVPIEVIVVDDGSTDASRSIIASYGSGIIPVLKENGGQASAFNAGYARSQGQVVIFLDADDVLLPDTATRVAAVFRNQPEVVKVQYRLEVIDSGGQATGAARPDWHQSMPQGDLRAQVLAFPDDIRWQPTSGNAFAASVLERIFPVPEDVYRICADYYLSNLPALFGPVVSLKEVGAYYRVHDSNQHHTGGLNLERTRQIITRTCHTHRYLKTHAESLGLDGFPEHEAGVPAVTFLAHRMASLKLDPIHHPLNEDRLSSLVVQGVRASLGRFDQPWGVRMLYSLWFVAMLVSPEPLVRWLVEQRFHSEARPAPGARPVSKGLLRLERSP